jgi:hypothetical protein
MEQFDRPRQVSTIKKDVPSLGGQDRHHQAQVEYAQGNGSFFRAFFLPVSWCSCENNL